MIPHSIEYCSIQTAETANPLQSQPIIPHHNPDCCPQEHNFSLKPTAFTSRRAVLWAAELLTLLPYCRFSSRLLDRALIAADERGVA